MEMTETNFSPMCKNFYKKNDESKNKSLQLLSVDRANLGDNEKQFRDERRHQKMDF